uniref:Uncharacterized protein n=1 Tax=Plectus sambesii TaxID=2011161 RepID=A0A914WNA2_9BILA
MANMLSLSLLSLLLTTVSISHANLDNQPTQCQVNVKDSLLRGFPVVFYTYVPEVGRCALRFSTNVWSGSPNVFSSAMTCIKTCCPASCRPHCCKGHLKEKSPKF